MKKKMYLLSLALSTTAFGLALLTTACLSQRVDLKEGLFEDRSGILHYLSRPFSGVLIERFPDGKVYKETRYKNGLKEGISKEYASNGALRVKWNFHQNQKDGFQEGWYIEGPKRFEANFKKGILEGIQTEWHINGTLFRKQTFLDGVETEKKILYPTAEIYSNYTKRDGRTFGLDGGALCFEVKKEGER